MAAGSIAITETREKVVDFTVPFMYYTDDLLVKKTSTETTDLLQFMDPFENGVWIATLGVVALISIAVFAVNYFSPYGYKDENGRGTSEEFNFFNSVWFSLACMLQQGGDNTPRNLSGNVSKDIPTAMITTHKVNYRYNTCAICAMLFCSSIGFACEGEANTTRYSHHFIVHFRAFCDLE